ncbi:ferric-chelate reductase [Microdochium nivale]|nr:ferric-chelate reductase [Microdochium nivale]
MDPPTGLWLLDVLGQVSRASHSAATVDGVMSRVTPAAGLPGAGTGGRPTPEQLAFVQRLVTHLLEGRRLINSYNLVLLACLAIFTARHFISVAHARRKLRRLDLIGQAPETSSDHSSSASSTLEGSISSTDSADLVAKAQPDVERQPLLGRRQPLRRQIWTGPLQLMRGWLMYQPRPIPLINKSLPANDTTVLVLAFLGLNAFYQCFHIPLDPKLLFIVADRAGLVFVANLPLLYLLAAKNQPVRRLTGYSYESLNILHRRVGELLCFEALVHGGCMAIWVIWTAPGWLQERFSNFFNTWLVILGLAALAAYELLYFTSLGSFRQRWYELFLASHVFLQAFTLVVLWLHQRNTRPFVGAALAIFVCDRLIWRLLLKSATVTADLRVLDDGETVLVSADWDIPSSDTKRLLLPRRNNVLRGWQPAEHVFISVPQLGRTHALQAHPFTIASAAPLEQSQTTLTSYDTGDTADPSSSSSPARHAQLSLLVRGHTGFTADLLRYAQSHSTVPVRLDGPYGSQTPLQMLLARRTSVLVAGGSGIAVIFPLVWSLATRGQRRHGHSQPGGSATRRKIHLLWIVHSESQRSWIPGDRLDELSRLGVEISLPEPTARAGRPDVPRYIDEVTAGAGASTADEVGVVVSGPDGLNRAARNACSAAVRRGRRVALSVEKFGW